MHATRNANAPGQPATEITGVHPDTKIAATIAVILAIPIAVTLTALIVQLLTYGGLWTWLPWVPPDNVL